ncbi:MAG: HEAT repeat domain-containing protein [Chloroflexi bacterium]|nr:HEAT repeat domain-containing protein [Chloroflexota bacterium]
MLNDLIRQLQDFDPAVRREAIIALGKTKNIEALRPLADIVLKDSDPELRELARKAGIYIQRENSTKIEEPVRPRRRTPVAPPPPEKPQGPRPRGPVFMAPEVEDPDSGDLVMQSSLTGEPTKGPVRGRNYNVPPDVRKRARAIIENALSDHMTGKPSRAMKNLTEALSLDPNLINDDYFGNIASTVTGLPADQAVQSIVDRGSRERFITSAERSERQRKVDDHLSTVRKTTRTDFAFELAIFCLIMVVGPVIASIIFVQGMSGFLNTVVESNVARDAVLDPAITDFQVQFANVSVLTFIPIALASLVSALLSLFIQMGLIHLIATKLLKGIGTFQHMLTTVLSFYNRLLPVLFVVLALSMVVAFFSQFSIISLCPAIVLIGIAGYIMAKTSGKVGEAYGFGGGLGCVSVLGSVLVLSVLNGVIGYIALQAMGFALQELLNSAILPSLGAIPGA